MYSTLEHPLHTPDFDMSKPVFPYMQAVLAFELLVFAFESYLNVRQYKKLQ